MKIAQISPLFESVPPLLYGGTERIVHYLTEELVGMGHDVTLFASADSRTSARLVPICGQALRLGNIAEPNACHIVSLESVFRSLGDFDVIHSHIEYLAYPYARRHPDVPMISTLHSRQDGPALQGLYREFPETRAVSISDAQREPIPWINWVATVHHGLPRDLFPFREDAGSYLAFLGRVSPEKGLISAIDIAIRAGLPLRIAAKVDPKDQEFFESRIKPLLSHPLVDYIGEIGDAEKADFLGGALALLFPIDWPEPFGLVMIEAMACGTPVIARLRGSVPEVMRHGVSGFVFETDQEAVEAVGRIGEISRAGCRAYFEERFTARRMADDYLRVYHMAEDLAAEAAEDWRHDGGGHQRQRQVLYHGQLLPGREAEQGPQARRNLRRIR